MTGPSRSTFALLVVLALSAVAFLIGIQWGLPSRAADRYLFGEQIPWPGLKIVQLAPADSASRGADVDANPIRDRTRPALINATDAERAEIIRRYRLFSYQPDEFITFKSLSRIRENRGDPRLYQYGGLWIYPVGALIKLALNPVSDQAHYLDHPEEFGRFYIVARLYSAAWGLLAVWAIFRMVRRMTDSLVLAAAGGLCFAFMPVVITMAHEAKPHLGGLALTLCAVLAGGRFVETARIKWAVMAGALCGAASAMVVSAVLSFAILPMMVLLRRERIPTLLQSTAVGVIVYVVLNPFVAINLLTNRDILASNLSNSTAMYAVSLGGLRNALTLLAEGASPVVFIAGVVGLVALTANAVHRRVKNVSDDDLTCADLTRGDAGWLLLAPAGAVAVQFILLADAKPPEYARFGLLPITFILVAAFTAIGRMSNPRARATLAVALTLLTGSFGSMYVLAFVRDCRDRTSRLAVAEEIRTLNPHSSRTIGLGAEPAPYIAPPIDLFTHDLLYIPPGVVAFPQVRIELDPSRSCAPISWADVRFRITTTRASK